jgi:hypothetical protein
MCLWVAVGTSGLNINSYNVPQLRHEPGFLEALKWTKNVLQGLRYTSLKAVLVAAAMIGGGAARAEQQLLATPYPQQLGPTAEFSPTPRTRVHQHLLSDPVPGAYGYQSQGNPRSLRVRRHQHLIPTPYINEGTSIHLPYIDR